MKEVVAFSIFMSLRGLRKRVMVFEISQGRYSWFSSFVQAAQGCVQSRRPVSMHVDLPPFLQGFSNRIQTRLQRACKGPGQYSWKYLRYVLSQSCTAWPQVHQRSATWEPFTLTLHNHGRKSNFSFSNAIMKSKPHPEQTSPWGAAE